MRVSRGILVNSRGNMAARAPVGKWDGEEGPPPPYNPAEFGSLLGAWYAGKGLTLAGDRVASWAPVYGTAGALVQGTEALQPTFGAGLGGGDAIIFDTGNELLSAITAQRNVVSLVMAMKPTSASCNGYAFVPGIYPSSYWSSGSTFRHVTGVETVVGGSYSPATYKRSVVSFAQGVSSVRVRVAAGAAVVGANTAASAALTALKMNPGQGQVSAIWLFGETLSDSNLDLAHAKMIEMYPEVIA